MEEKQTYPDSVSLLSSVQHSKNLDGIMSVCGQSRLRVSACNRESTGSSGRVLAFVCWNVTPDSLRKSSGEAGLRLRMTLKGVFLPKSLDRSVLQS